MNRIEFLEELTCFKKEYRRLPLLLAFFVILAYGGRVIHDNIFLDSEIMILRPYYMQQVWLGSNRFGLVLTSRLFGMGRLVPWLSGFLMAVVMWASGLALAFCAYTWCRKNRQYYLFVYLFPVLYVTSPIFAGQYLFILQAFEISFAILLDILASFCVGNYVYRGGRLWLAAGLLLMVWSFGSYQAMLPLYISLVLLSFLLTYMNQSRDENQQAFTWGIKHLLVFGAGTVLYAGIAALIKILIDSDSAYVSGLLHWKSDGWRMCLQYIWLELVQVLKAKTIFYHKLYLPAMLLFVLQAMFCGWKKRADNKNYFWFLLGGGLYLSSPFFLTLVTGFFQQIRSQMVYPLTCACFFAYITVLPKELFHRAGVKWKKPILGTAAAVCIFAASRNTMLTAQLFQTSWEAYRNDVLTANRLYRDICHAANREDMENCRVIFTGKRDAGLAGPAVLGELSGLSFFEAEAHTPMGVSGRAISLFFTLGMDLQVELNPDLYKRAVNYMEDAPNWPAQGSIREMDGFILVRLSE